MTRHVVVIGAGVAGTAAAYAAAGAGARVSVLIGRPGASSLGSGALDDALERDPKEGDEVRTFVEALGIWDLPNDRCFVATSAGLVREVRGRDRAVLDLGRVRAGVVAVLDGGRRGWSAALLASAWTEDPWSRARGLRFEPVDADLLRFADEAWLPAPDLAERHDDVERQGWLIERLARPDLRDKTAIVIEPWLGIRAQVAERLCREMGIPVGEPLSRPGGAPGLRFERARDELLARSGVIRSTEWAHAVSLATRLRVELDSGGLDADSVVLAVGGLVGGGIGWAPADAQGFILSLACDAALALRGEPLSTSGSPRGALFETYAWSGHPAASGFERVGIWIHGDGRVRNRDGKILDGIYAAGDAVADAPRTLVSAIRSGLAAGRLAAGGASV